MQSTTVMAFRKRMKSHGYTEISIYKIRPFTGNYLVFAREPLTNSYVSVRMTEIAMGNAFRF